jgi:hypothetical protein
MLVQVKHSTVGIKRAYAPGREYGIERSHAQLNTLKIRHMYLTSKSYMGVMHPEPSSPPPFPLKVATALQVGGHTGWMDWLGADVNGIEKKKKKKKKLIQVIGGKSCVGGVAGTDTAEEVGGTAWTEAVSAWAAEGGVAFESVAGGCHEPS